MFENPGAQSPTPVYVEARAVSYGALLAQTMMLVAIAIGLLAAGALIGRDYSQGTAMAFSIAGFAMLLVSNFVPALRNGTLGTAWLFGLALAIGLGAGRLLAYYVEFNPDVVAEAAGMTGVTVLGAASIGTFMSKDLKAWMRPLSLIVFAAAIISWGMLAFGSGGSPIISGVIGVVSAVLIVVDFNYLRKHADEDDVVWLATGIFVSIINIFFSLLNILDD